MIYYFYQNNSFVTNNKNLDLKINNNKNTYSLFLLFIKIPL